MSDVKVRPEIFDLHVFEEGTMKKNMENKVTFN